MNTLPNLEKARQHLTAAVQFLNESRTQDNNVRRSQQVGYLSLILGELAVESQTLTNEELEKD